MQTFIHSFRALGWWLSHPLMERGAGGAPLLPSTASKCFPAYYQTVRRCKNLFLQNPFKWIYSKNLISNSVFLFISTGPFKRNRSVGFYWGKLFLVRKGKMGVQPKISFLFFFFSHALGNGGPNEKGADQGGMNHRWGKNRVVFLREQRQYHGVRRRSNQRRTFTAISVRLTPGSLD